MKVALRPTWKGNLLMLAVADRRLGCCQLRAPYSRVWLLIPRSLSILAMAFSLSAFRSAYL